MGDVIIPGFPTGMLVPGIYINVELGRQPPSAAGVARKVLLVGENTGGVAAAGKLYRISRLRSNDKEHPENDLGSAEGLFGRDEETPLNTRLFWMAKAAFAANATVSLYAIKVDDTETYQKIFTADATSPIAKQRFHYIVVDEISQYSTLITYLEQMAAPQIGFRQQGIVGHHKKSPPAKAEISPRSPRLQYVWSPQSDSDGLPPAADVVDGKRYYGMMLAAATASIRSRHEGVDPAVNLCMERIPGVPTAPASNATTKSGLNTLIQEGFTPLVSQGTSTVILRSVTTVATTEVEDTYPVLDTSKVTVTDFVADDVEMKMVNRYTGFKLAPDTDIPPPAMTATPNGIKSSLLEWLRLHEKAGRITCVTDLSERVLVEIDEDVPGRVNFQIPEDVIEILAVGAGNIIQIG